MAVNDVATMDADQAAAVVCGTHRADCITVDDIATSLVATDQDADIVVADDFSIQYA